MDDWYRHTMWGLLGFKKSRGWLYLVSKRNLLTRSGARDRTMSNKTKKKEEDNPVPKSVSFSSDLTLWWIWLQMKRDASELLMTCLGLTSDLQTYHEHPKWLTPQISAPKRCSRVVSAGREKNGIKRRNPSALTPLNGYIHRNMVPR